MKPWVGKKLIKRTMLVCGGLALLPLGVLSWEQFVESEAKAPEVASPIAPPKDEFLAKTFRELADFCSRSPDGSPLGAPSPQSAIAVAKVEPADGSQPPTATAQATDAQATDAQATAAKQVPCPNFQASKWPQPATPAQPPESPKLMGRLTRLLGYAPEAKPQAQPVPIAVPEAAANLDIHPMARLAKVPILMYHDILPEKEVFFDVTPGELEQHFEYLKSEGMTPISPDMLYAHLRTGAPLPPKSVLLSFDDGYGGHYQYVFPLLKKYGYPATFSIYIKKMEGKTGRSSVTWDQLKEMAADSLVTIAAHSVTHPRDLRELSDDELAREVMQSKQILEKQLQIPIAYFTYPEGKYDARVKQWAIAAGYKAAFAMSNTDEQFAGESPDLMAIGRFGQSRLRDVVPQAWGGYPAPVKTSEFNFATPIERRDYTIDKTPFMIISGGRPGTIHADSRYQVPEILAGTSAIAAVDGGFFSLKYLDSNVMIGPVLSLSKGFVPGNASENPRLNGRPLAAIGPQSVRFIPFDATKHNTFAGITAEALPGETITDAFVGAAWLVRDGKPQPAEAFGNLFDFDANRHRAFWGINHAGQPVIGVSKYLIDSISLGKALHQMGFRDAIMLDSGASTSLALNGESLVEYPPRPVPHVVAQFPPLFSPASSVQPVSDRALLR